MNNRKADYMISNNKTTKSATDASIGAQGTSMPASVAAAAAATDASISVKNATDAGIGAQGASGSCGSAAATDASIGAQGASGSAAAPLRGAQQLIALIAKQLEGDCVVNRGGYCSMHNKQNCLAPQIKKLVAELQARIAE